MDTTVTDYDEECVRIVTENFDGHRGHWNFRRFRADASHGKVMDHQMPARRHSESNSRYWVDASQEEFKCLFGGTRNRALKARAHKYRISIRGLRK
jgi:hypothetical protein